MRLIDHLASLGLSPRAAREALQSGKVHLRGCPVADGGREVDPAEVRYRVDAPRVVMGRDPFVLFKDAWYAVAWKPSGLLSVPAPNREDEPNLLALLGRRYGSVFPVHRLDEETSGLIVVALRPDAQETLKDLLERHAVERRYLALVAGRFEKEGTHASVMIRDRGDGLRGSVPGSAWRGPFDATPPAPAWVPTGGKVAVTRFRYVDAAGGASLVEAQLETGRTHQVRIHLAECGHPVLGDGLYGQERDRRDRRGGRLALHAWRLAFTHPYTRARIELEAPLADDLDLKRRVLRGEAKPRPKVEAPVSPDAPPPPGAGSPGPRRGEDPARRTTRRTGGGRG
jgi:23S rRNA pseudouridine1911/1915/1917 synthase